MSEQTLLEVENLRIDIVSGSTKHNVVEDVSFTIGAGETFGLVGESGCGKSITALSMIGLLRKPLSITGGAIRFKGQDLRSMSSREMRKLRGNRIAMIFQEPMTALNPLSPVGRQIAEMFVLHQGATWHEAERKAVEALASVQVPAPEQRVTVQAEILRLMQELCTARGTSVLMISHDLGVIAKMCRRVGVMYAGHLVEERITAGLFHHPAHPYAHGLLASLPQLGSRQKEGQLRLQEIEGVVPSISAFPAGCRFEPRCTRATDICRAQKPGWTPLEDAGVVRCFHHE
jgi:peptide/nickel transport system ATP-binding protein